MDTEDAINSPARPVDLEIRITTPWGQGGRQIQYVLSSPSQAVDVHHETIAGPVLHDPDGFQKRWFGQLEELHRGKDVQGRPVLRNDLPKELISLGHDLYQTLFPRELRSMYRDFRDRVTTLLITSDEPWIPWEMVRPAELDGDDFLCMSFQMGRWLAGGTSLAAGKTIRRWEGFSANPGGDLKQAEAELRALADLAGRFSGLEGEPHLGAHLHQLVEVIEAASFDLLHFAGHGRHDDERPAEAEVLLGKAPFLARHLSPEAEKRLREQRPLVFYNACQVGRLNRSLTDLDGWAHRWVRRCGCSAFLAPLWPVRDRSALYFSQVFYHHLGAGRPLGEAVMEARHALRSENPTSMAWLAYSFYGHPNARIQLGDQSPPPSTDLPSVPPRPPRPPQRPSPARRTHVFRAAAETGSGTLSRGSAPNPAEPTHGFGPRLEKPLPFRFKAIAATLALTIGLSWVSTRIQQPGPPVESWTNKPPEIKTISPEPSEGGDTLGKKNEADNRVAEPIVTEKKSPPPRKENTSTPEAKSSIPMEPIVPGKIAILVLDKTTQKPDLPVAYAIESVLVEAIDNASLLVPTTDDFSYIAALLSGDLSGLPGGSQSPWSAEYLVVASTSRANLPQANSIFEGTRLNCRVKLIETSKRTIESNDSSVHNGIGPSTDAAILQAVERCMRKTTETIQGENDAK